MKPPDIGQVTMALVTDSITRVDANRRGSVVAELAILTILIDAGICSIEEACSRIEHIQSTMGQRYNDDETPKRITQITAWLRAHDKPADSATPRWTPVVLQGGLDHDSPDDPIPQS